MTEAINDELLNIINDGESVTTEFKKAKNKSPNNLSQNRLLIFK